MSEEPRTLLSEQEYLSLERQAEFRSEYLAGETFAMVRATRRHNRIFSNLVISLGNQLRERPCNVYSSDLRVRVSNTGLYTYPDVVVTSGEEEFADAEQDTLLTPMLLMEILSLSTEAYDRGKKFEHYQTVESLSTYVLVARYAQRVEWYERQGGGTWIYTGVHGDDASFGIESIDCELSRGDVYAKV